MKALELHGLRDLRLAEHPEPTPGPGELLLRVEAVGVCGSDMHFYAEGRIGADAARPGFVPGHEFAGTVVKRGAGVRVRDFRIGDRVAVDPANPCGRCEPCRHGHPNLCPHVRFAGQPPDIDGALQELFAWPAHCCYKLPDALSTSDGAMLEPLGVGLHAVNLSKVKLGDTVVIVGCGPIGLSTLLCARRAGARRVIMLDKLAYRLAVARAMGADDTLLVTEAGGHVDTVLDWTGGGAQVVFEAAGKEDAMRDAPLMARAGGRVLWIGIPPGDSITFSAHETRRKGLTLMLVRRMKHSYERLIPLLAGDGEMRTQLGSMATHTFTLEDGARAFELVRGYTDGVIKAIIQPNPPA